MITALYQEFITSIKSPDTEEKLDLIFYRPLGFIIAKIAFFLKATPSILSIIGLISGLFAAWNFLQNNWQLGSILFLLSGIFDSSDGQLARIAGQFSKIGLVLDGICDSIVIGAIYIAGSYPYFTPSNYSFLLLTAIGAVFHSNQCAILDFYHREYLYFCNDKTDEEIYWNPGIEEMHQIINNSKSSKEKFFNKARVTWIKQQQLLTSRSDYHRDKLRSIARGSDHIKKNILKENYIKLNKPLLPFWRLLGSNFHTLLIITFMFFQRFDLYLILFDIILLNIVLFVMYFKQKNADKKLFTLLEINE